MLLQGNEGLLVLVQGNDSLYLRCRSSSVRRSTSAFQAAPRSAMVAGPFESDSLSGGGCNVANQGKMTLLCGANRRCGAQNGDHCFCT